MSLQILLRSDYPPVELIHECSGDATIAALKEVLASSDQKLTDLDRYVVRAASFGGDTIEVDEDEETLADLEIVTQSSILFFAPPELRPGRNLSKKEEEKQEEKAKASGGGFGKYAAFNHANCFQKMKNKKKAEQKLALEYIEAEASSLLDVKKNDLFLNLPAKQLIQIIKGDRLNIKEGDLFSAVGAWGGRHKNADMKAVYAHVRFPNMDVQTIATTVASSGILDQKQLLSLFGHTALPPSSRPSSLAGFSTEQCKPRNPRFIGCIFDQSGSKVNLSDDKRTASYSGGTNWQGSATCTPCKKYSFEVKGGCNNLMVGFTDVGKMTLEGNNYSKNTGYYFYLVNGSLYGKGKSSSSYASTCHTPGTKITCEWDKDSGNISFYVNGVNKGVAYTGVTQDVVPAFDFYDSGSIVELCDHPSA